VGGSATGTGLCSATRQVSGPPRAEGLVPPQRKGCRSGARQTGVEVFGSGSATGGQICRFRHGGDRVSVLGSATGGQRVMGSGLRLDGWQVPPDADRVWGSGGGDGCGLVDIFSTRGCGLI